MCPLINQAHQDSNPHPLPPTKATPSHPPGYRNGLLYSSPNIAPVLETSFDVPAYTRDARGRIRVAITCRFDARTRIDLEFLWRLEVGALSKLRELLVSWTGNESRITAFLATWAYERYWFGRALQDLLGGDGATPAIPAPSSVGARLRHIYTESILPVTAPVLGKTVGEPVTAGHMARMAIHEKALQVAQESVMLRLEPGEARDVLATIVQRRTQIVEFFELEARARIQRSRAEQVSAAAHLSYAWNPLRVVGVADSDETRALRSIFDTLPSRAALSACDEPISSLLPSRPTPAAKLADRIRDPRATGKDLMFRSISYGV